jgi:two-component system chemotaxis response regulator CheY
MGIRFLVVDDFDTMIRIIKSVLNELGYDNVITARHGEQACQILSHQKIDFIISDWNMPVMSGIELLKRVKGNPQWSHIPFLMVTAEAEKEHIIEAIQAKVDQYIIKPFTADMLGEKINFALRKKQDTGSG